MKASLIVTGLLFGGVLLAEADFGQLCSDGAKAAKEKDFVNIALYHITQVLNINFRHCS